MILINREGVAMWLKNLLVLSALFTLTGCGYGSYHKTDRGSVENSSKYSLDVEVTEGCYGSKAHLFTVAPGETSPFDYSYRCSGLDTENAEIRVTYAGYEERGYVFYKFDPSPYTSAVFAEGSVVKFYEDTEPKEHALVADELSALPVMGFRSNVMVYTREQMIRIRPSTESIAQLYYGIHKTEISPFIPLIFGNFEAEGIVYQPMDKDYYKHNPDYSGQKLTLVCDDINCVAK